MRISGWLGSSSAKLKLILLSAIVIAGVAAWMIFPGRSDAQNEPVATSMPAVAPAQDTSGRDIVSLESATAPIDPAPATQVQAAAVVPTDTPVARAAVPPEAAPAEKSPLEGLKISRQSWRRGGLGSKALITLTLRNRNDYPVKDIEVACAFARRDGSHLTDRKRVIGDIIEMKSRKTYAGMLVGFVNINADRAKCSLVTASRA
jgi:hypothetical protein